MGEDEDEEEDEDEDEDEEEIKSRTFILHEDKGDLHAA